MSEECDEYGYAQKKERVMRHAVTFLALGLVFLGAAQAADTVELPKPRMKGGAPLMEALKARRTTRRFSGKALPRQTLSNLLWAAFGVNRPSGKRTAPSAVNWREIDIYVAKADGLFLFLPRRHALKRVLAEDIRAMTGIQRFTQVAPVNLIYVADFAKMRRASLEDKKFYSAVDTGFISQNVYLFAASEGLATVVLGMVRRDDLAKKMKLRADQKVILTQPVGYPAK